MQWVIRDEKTKKVLAKHPESDFKEADQVIEEYRSLPNHFTVKLEK